METANLRLHCNRFNILIFIRWITTRGNDLREYSHLRVKHRQYLMWTAAYSFDLACDTSRTLFIDVSSLCKENCFEDGVDPKTINKIKKTVTRKCKTINKFLRQTKQTIITMTAITTIKAATTIATMTNITTPLGDSACVGVCVTVSGVPPTAEDFLDDVLDVTGGGTDVCCVDDDFVRVDGDDNTRDVVEERAEDVIGSED